MKEEEEVERLVSEAGPRSALPERDLAEIREAARVEWAARYPGPGVRGTARSPGGRPRVRGSLLGLAAALLLAAAAAVLVWRTRAAERAPAAPEGDVASVERAPEGSRWTVGRAIAGGTTVETAAGDRIALRMAGGASVRFDEGTRARLASASVVELDSGAVYVDTRGAAEVGVRAPAGVVRPVGTQFEVRIEGAATRLKVREGNVEIERSGEPVRAAAGEELTVGGDGAVGRRPIPPYGPEWAWVLEAAAPPDIEGMKVRAFLDWIARETGRRIEFSDPEAEAVAGSVDLHGSIDHLGPLEATGVVLASAGLEHRVSDGTILVSASKKGRP